MTKGALFGTRNPPDRKGLRNPHTPLPPPPHTREGTVPIERVDIYISPLLSMGKHVRTGRRATTDWARERERKERVVCVCVPMFVAGAAAVVVRGVCGAVGGPRRRPCVRCRRPIPLQLVETSPSEREREETTTGEGKEKGPRVIFIHSHPHPRSMTALYAEKEKEKKTEALVPPPCKEIYRLPVSARTGKTGSLGREPGVN